jgi:hypothetical protein
MLKLTFICIIPYSFHYIYCCFSMFGTVQGIILKDTLCFRSLCTVTSFGVQPMGSGGWEALLSERSSSFRRVPWSQNLPNEIGHRKRYISIEWKYGQLVCYSWKRPSPYVIGVTWAHSVPFYIVRSFFVPVVYLNTRSVQWQHIPRDEFSYNLAVVQPCIDQIWESPSSHSESMYLRRLGSSSILHNATRTDEARNRPLAGRN